MQFVFANESGKRYLPQLHMYIFLGAGEIVFGEVLMSMQTILTNLD